MATLYIESKRQFRPKAGAVYITDGGRLLCDRHLGTSASYTGRDLSGQRIAEITPEEARENTWISCETCGARPRILVLV